MEKYLKAMKRVEMRINKANSFIEREKLFSELYGITGVAVEDNEIGTLEFEVINDKAKELLKKMYQK